MMAWMVSSILLLIAVLFGIWLLSPRFRDWAERPKYTMLERTRAVEQVINKHSRRIE